MSGELAGRLRERVVLWREAGERDALGTSGGWSEVGLVWAEVRPAGRGGEFAGETRAGLPLWRVTMRARDVRPGDRIERVMRSLVVREATVDPAAPDRIVAIAEEER